jgi:hypothetical protein
MLLITKRIQGFEDKLEQRPQILRIRRCNKDVRVVVCECRSYCKT